MGNGSLEFSSIIRLIICSHLLPKAACDILDDVLDDANYYSLYQEGTGTNYYQKFSVKKLSIGTIEWPQLSSMHSAFNRFPSSTHA